MREEAQLWLSDSAFALNKPTCTRTSIMADATVVSNKLAMSKALGAAFLNHQVEQLEKSVHSGGNWRERRNPDSWRAGETKKAFGAPKIIQRRREESNEEKKKYPDGPKAEREYERRERRSEDGKAQKDADIVVVDATVLVHGLYHLKKWCREGREEIVIVPLEGEPLISHCCLSPVSYRSLCPSAVLSFPTPST